ncbi:Plant-drug/metabolite exporter [Parasponia andersonii]|uniref:WAT1-related protein n=1 Tax=Parasponia andersonii TaxID=3476 RepID=A0A2P5AE24_PARAD|nr:Plant-drug/metabolite exporter [Parasponia andersonii]
MVAVELATVGVNTVYKAAALKGLSYLVFVAYTYVLGTLVLVRIPSILGRRELPSLQPPFLLRIFLLGLIGYERIMILSNICAYKGLDYSSPTLASAVSNLTPASTFILAVIFRMENLDLRSYTTHIKITGTMFSIAGALVAVLYRPTLLSSASSSPSSQLSLSLQYPLGTSAKYWVIGCLLLDCQCLLYSIWYILQTRVMKLYPDEKIVVAVNFLCTATMAVPICFIGETKLSAWTLRPDIELVAVGFFGQPFRTLVHTWGLHLKGPLYISIFRPLSIAMAAAVGVIFLGDALCLGSVLGAAILLLGFYAVIWAKAWEDYTENCGSDDLGALLDGKTPLLGS